MNSALNFWLSTIHYFYLYFRHFLRISLRIFLFVFIFDFRCAWILSFFTQMLSIQFDASSPRSKSQTTMTETKTNFVCSLKWMAHKKKIERKRDGNAMEIVHQRVLHMHPIESGWHYVYELSGFSRQKVKSEHKTLDGNIFFFLFNFYPTQTRTCNLDACHSNMYAKMKCAKGLKYSSKRQRTNIQMPKRVHDSMHLQKLLTFSLPFFVFGFCALMCISYCRLHVYMLTLNGDMFISWASSIAAQPKFANI